MPCPVPSVWQIPPSESFDNVEIRLASINNLMSTCITSDHMTVLSDPVDGTDVTNKAYVDSKTIFRWKSPVVVSTTTNIALSGVPVVIDAYTVHSSDRVLVQFQTNGIENGIYVATVGTWSRSADLPIGYDASGVAVWVLEGSQYIHTAFVCDNLPSSDIVGTNSLNFVQFSAGGAVQAGDALTLTGNTLDVNVDGTTIGINGSNQLKLINNSITLNGQNGISIVPTTIALGSSATVSLNPLYSNFLRLVPYVTVTSLPYTLSASELLSTYIIVSVNGTGDLTFPTVSSIVSAIGTFVANMAFNFSILKNGTNHMHIITTGTGITSPVTLNMDISADNVSNFVLIITTGTTATLLPLGADHGI
jgi:hypothetical protein